VRVIEALQTHKDVLSVVTRVHRAIEFALDLDALSDQMGKVMGDVVGGKGALLPRQGEMGQGQADEQHAAAPLQMLVWPRPPDAGSGEEENGDEQGRQGHGRAEKHAADETCE
jgi:hypothetical protein